MRKKGTVKRRTARRTVQRARSTTIVLVLVTKSKRNVMIVSAGEVRDSVPVMPARININAGGSRPISASTVLPRVTTATAQAMTQRRQTD